MKVPKDPTSPAVTPRHNPYLRDPSDIFGEMIEAAIALGASSPTGELLLSDRAQRNPQAAEALMQRCEDLQRESLDNLASLGGFMWRACEGNMPDGGELSDHRLIFDLGVMIERLVLVVQGATFYHNAMAFGLRNAK